MDGILIHSIKPVADEVLTFGRMWRRRSPLVLVPTSSCRTALSEFGAADVTMVDVEPSPARLDHLFELLDCDELRHAERLYSFPAVKPGVS